MSLDDDEEHDSEIESAPVCADPTRNVDVDSSDTSELGDYSDDQEEVSIEQAGRYLQKHRAGDVHSALGDRQ